MLFRSVVGELLRLKGEMLVRQQARLQELLAAGRRMDAEAVQTRPPGASQLIQSAGGAPRSIRQGSSPHLGMPKEKSVNSAQKRNMQIGTCDPSLAGKQVVTYAAGHLAEA